MKKFITILLAMLLCFAVASCDEGKEEKSLIKTGRDFCAVENGVFFIDNENMKFLKKLPVHTIQRTTSMV